MNTPRLESVFEHIARLISQRPPDAPFTFSALQAALQDKFPNFSLSAYGMSSWRDFLRAAEQADYFKVVNTGDPKTSYLVLSGSRALSSEIARTTAQMQAADPRQQRWMTETLELMLLAEHGAQILESIANLEALSQGFADFLAAQERLATLYYVRGKIRRLREFLATLRTQGEARALALWKPARSLLRFPEVPPVKEAPRLAQQLSAVFQGEARLDQLPIESVNNLFFGVIGFLKHRLSRERAWDWLVGLQILEEEARALPRPAPRRGMLGIRQTSSLAEPLDEAQIEAYTQLLLKEAGIRATQDDTPRWRAYLAAPSLDAALTYLAEHADLLRDDALLAWLDDELARAVEANEAEAVRNLANKSAILMVAREHGAEGARGKVAELRGIYQSVLQGAQLLSKVFAYLRTGTPAQALAFLQAAPDFLQDETVDALLEEQLIKAARAADVGRYRRVRQRADLWRKVADLGIEQGSTQHARALAAEGDDRALLTEMGVLLLPMAKDADETRELVERFPSVATPEGLALITQNLELLSFQGAPPEEYQRYYDVQRLIARCLEIGVDRALLELR